MSRATTTAITPTDRVGGAPMRRDRGTVTGYSVTSSGAEERCYRLVRLGLVAISPDGRITRAIGPHAGRSAAYWSGHLMQFYARVGGVQYGCSAARLVWLHFHGPIPPRLVVVQRDGNRRNLAPENLTLVTEGQAIHLAYRQGRIRRACGTRNKSAKLDEHKVRAIRLRRMDHARLIDIAREFGISIATAEQIANRKTWRHVA